MFEVGQLILSGVRVPVGGALKNANGSPVRVRHAGSGVAPRIELIDFKSTLEACKPCVAVQARNRQKTFLRQNNNIINPMKNHRSLLASLLTISLALIFTDTAQAGAGLAVAGAGPSVAATVGGAPVTPAPAEPQPSSSVDQPPSMRAKFRFGSVTRHQGYDEITFDAVCPPSFDADGLSEDSTFSKWTPTANLKMSIAHPALIGRYNQGDTFYVDFTPVIPDEQCVKLCTADRFSAGTDAVK